MTQEEEKNLIARIEKLEKQIGKLKFPLDLNSQSTLEQAFFSKLNVYKLKCGLPIYTVVRSDTPHQGEFYLINISSSPQIQTFVNGVKYTWTPD